MARYQLYIGDKNYSSWSMRPWVLLRHFEIPFDEHLRRLDTRSEYTSFSPSGKVPCLYDGSAGADAGQAIVVWDSLAIAEYVADAHPAVPIWPPLAPATRAARAFARCAAAEMHSGFGAVREQLNMNCGLRVDLGPAFADGANAEAAALRKELVRLDALWAEGLARFGGPWLAGAEFGAVDAFFAPVATRLQTYPAAAQLLSEPARAYAARLLENPAVKEWIDAGLREEWRVERYEQTRVMGGRKVLADHRKKE